VTFTKNPAPCGTPQAYSRHLYHEEEPCDDCKQAHTDEMRSYRHSRGIHRARRWKHGTYAGAQKHAALGETPCDPCRLARNEYMREWRRGRTSVRRRPAWLNELIVDVLETFGGSMTTREIIEAVIRIRPGAKPASVHRALFRLDEVENFSQLGERRWRLN